MGYNYMQSGILKLL